jgi:hypothetical protein
MLHIHWSFAFFQKVPTIAMGRLLQSAEDREGATKKAQNGLKKESNKSAMPDQPRRHAYTYIHLRKLYPTRVVLEQVEDAEVLEHLIGAHQLKIPWKQWIETLVTRIQAARHVAAQRELQARDKLIEQYVEKHGWNFDVRQFKIGDRVVIGHYK